MDGTIPLTMGDRGRIVVPAEVRERRGLTEGTHLVMVDTQDGILLLTRAQLRERVRRDLAGLDLVQELLDGRRVEAATEDRG